LGCHFRLSVLAQRHFEIAAELTDEINCDTAMNAALFVAETRPLAAWKNWLMPNARVNMQSE
jgi:hypothetical protein